MEYQAKLKVPFGVLGIRCTAGTLTAIDFLPAGTPPQPPRDAFSRKVCEQLQAYLAYPAFQFDLPLQLNGTAHRLKVWHAMQRIPSGATRSYGELAAELHSGAQAVGQACGANPIPIVVPCHRVVGQSGLGGFMRHAGGESLDIKRWLLAHERATLSPLQGEGRSEKAPLPHPSPTSGRGEKK